MTGKEQERGGEGQGRGANDQTGPGSRPPSHLVRRSPWLRKCRGLLLGAAGLLATALGLSLTVLIRSLAPPARPPAAEAARDPRLDYAGPFENVGPAVHYAPEDRCVDCHPDKARSFAQHPMGRSLLPVAQAGAPPEDRKHNNPLEAFGSLFRVESKGARVRHTRTQFDPSGRPAAELTWEVHYVLGAGTQGHAYLTDRGGYLFKLTMSWYVQKQGWDLSPGFERPELTGRPVLPGCLFCHANRANYQEGSINRYAEPAFDGCAIGCQRCHGPGALHVAAREAGESVPGSVDYTIVNPRHLEPALREAVCEQCHLEGEARVVRRGRGMYDYRPGLPLESFWSVFVRASGGGGGQSVVGHVEQMYQSKCFQGSHGSEKLGCVSCHDPHKRVPAERRVAYYRERCLRCHEQHGCSLPPADRLRRTAGDSCIDCHMPYYGLSNIPHAAATDHRILRNGKPAAAGPGRPVSENARPLVAFYRDRKGAEGESGRDWAMALTRMAYDGDLLSAPPPGVLPPLETAWRQDPDDLDAGEARAYALLLLGHPAEALAGFEEVLARAPRYERTLVGAATAAEELGRTGAAVGYWRRAAAANPWLPDYRRHLVQLLVKKEAWDEARPECEAWERLDPFSTEARGMRVRCLLAAGNKGEARAEFARIEALAPEDLPELWARFGKKLGITPHW